MRWGRKRTGPQRWPSLAASTACSASRLAPRVVSAVSLHPGEVVRRRLVDPALIDAGEDDAGAARVDEVAKRLACDSRREHAPCRERWPARTAPTARRCRGARRHGSPHRRSAQAATTGVAVRRCRRGRLQRRVLRVLDTAAAEAADVIAARATSCSTMWRPRNPPPPVTSTFQRGPVLHWAAFSGNQALVRLLLERGADPRRLDGVRIARRTACSGSGMRSNGRFDRVLSRIFAGDPSPARERDTSWGPPLNAAAGKGLDDHVQILLKYGADPLETTRRGEPRSSVLAPRWTPSARARVVAMLEPAPP